MSAKAGASNTLQKRLQVLAFLHGRGRTLEECSDRRYLGLSERTLEKYARKLGLAFPDYTPRSLKAKKEQRREKTDHRGRSGARRVRKRASAGSPGADT